MSLIVDDPEAQRLAQAISQATGDSVAQVVTQALRARYAVMDRESQAASLEELRTIAKRVAAGICRPPEDHGTLLYDEHGLPK